MLPVVVDLDEVFNLIQNDYERHARSTSDDVDVAITQCGMSEGKGRQDQPADMWTVDQEREYSSLARVVTMTLPRSQAG